MLRFLLKFGYFTAFTSICYVCITGVYYQNDKLRTRWNQGIPNWIYESNLGEHLSQFEAYCQKNPATRINLILGSSTALHGVFPEILGDNWYSLATRGQHPAASEIMLDLAKRVTQNSNVSIDTIIVDVYPEFTQEWVYQRADAYEHMALTLKTNHLLQQGQRVFSNGGFRRFHNALSYRLFASKNPHLTSDRIHGYEMHHDSAFNAAPLIDWDGHLNQDCLDALRRFPKENCKVVFMCPPVLHENHCQEVSIHMPVAENVTSLDANQNEAIKDSSYFFDDHHLNHRGAIQNTLWIQSRLR